MTPPAHPAETARRRRTLPSWSCLPALLALAGAAAAEDAAPVASPAPPAAAVSQPAKPSVSAHPAPKASQPRMAQAARPEARPTWFELTLAQQQALQPLAASWSGLGEQHKRKWLAVSSNFPTMPPGEQARLHSRMAEWAALSPQQRNQARLNFAETQTLPVDDKRAKWEAYQALSPEEKKKLAAGAGKPVPSTAAAVQPVPPQKLATVPKPRKPEASSPRTIAIAPGKIDNNTLLPQPGTLPPTPP